MSKYSKYTTEALQEMEKKTYSDYYKAATRPCGNWHEGMTFPELEEAEKRLEEINEELKRRREEDKA